MANLQSARIALIGCGAAAALDRAVIRRLLPRSVVYVDSNAGSDDTVATSLAQALDHVDAAIVSGVGTATRRVLHDLQIAAKPVLCGPEVVAAAATSVATPWIVPAGLRWFAGSYLRFGLAAQRVRALLKSSQLGSILSFDARLGDPLPPDAVSAAYWSRSVAGGGALVDPGMHVLDLLAWWLGPLTPRSLSDDSVGGVEAEAAACVATAGGVTGIVEISRLRPLRNSVVLTGTQGQIEMHLQEMTLRVEPQTLLEHPPLEATVERGPIIERLHRRRIEQWLDACVLRTVPVSDVLAEGNAIATLSGLYAMRKRLLHPWEATVPRSPHTAAGGTTLADRAVLVTGGAGFIGARLVEKLVERGARVTVTVRNLRRVARIARLGVSLKVLDLRATGALDEVVAGQDVVFGLAYDFRRSGRDNLAMHRQLADACLRHRVRRFVHMSSVAVYDDWPSGMLDEASPKDGTGSEYKTAKREMEIDLVQRAAGGMSVVILEPTIVYGPFSMFWTDHFALQLRAGTVVLPRDGLGLCSGVYVDDVVEALIAAAARAHANAESWIISGERPFEWAKLIAGYADALGKQIEYDNSSKAVDARPVLDSLRHGLARIMHAGAARHLLVSLREWLGEDRVERLRARAAVIRRKASQSVFRPAAVDPSLYLAKGVCSIEKARRELGFAPAFDLEEGLRRTGDYLRWRYLADVSNTRESYPTDDEAA